jgi:hypothetical protein
MFLASLRHHLNNPLTLYDYLIFGEIIVTDINSYLSYLKGDSFSNGLDIWCDSGSNDVPQRIDIIESLVAGKKIIHVGCVDHLPLIKEKVKNDLWLHGRLCSITKRCIGLDINEEGIEYLKNELACDDVFCENILISENIEGILGNDDWDFIVLGEILEHVDNPHQFLQSLHDKFRGKVRGIIITVPNAFCFDNLVNTFKGKECINSDHRYWFTVYTLSKLLTLSEYKIDKYELCELGAHLNRTIKSRIRAFLSLKLHMIRIFPLLRETIVIVAKL